MTKQQRLALAIKNYTGIKRGRNAVNYKEEARRRAAAQYAGLLGRQDEMSAIPQNSLLGSISSGLESARDFGNKATVPDFIPYLGGTGVGDMIVGQSPEEVKNWSYGNFPFDMPYQSTGGLLPRIKPNRQTSLGDTLLFGADLIGVGAVAKPLAKAAIKGATPKAQEMLENTMRKTGLLSDAAPYHGTPYKFLPTERNPLGEFDAIKIGTGANVRTHGYGHHLAENKSTAKAHADALAIDHMDSINQVIQALPAKPTAKDVFFEMQRHPSLKDFLNSSQVKNDIIVATRSLAANRVVPSRVTALMGAYKRLDKLLPPPQKFLYKVDLPDEQIAKMLDWDKPLSQQAPEVQALIKKAHDLRAKQTGAQFTLDMNVKGGDWLPTIGEGRLKEVGIPGIKYLDQGPRAGDKGTRNFVVFPGGEKMLNILERN